MQPLMYSERLAKDRNIGWTRRGHDISYTQNTANMQCPLLNRDRNYYVLEWKMVLCVSFTTRHNCLNFNLRMCNCLCG